MREKEEDRLSQEKLERPNTQWVFEAPSDVWVKLVFTRQPLMGTGPLPDWLRALAHGRHGIVCLDTYQDNLCLWRCPAVHQGTRPDWSTQKARELAQSFLQLGAPPHDCEKTSLDELDKVEQYFNHEKPVSDWLGIRVYDPEKQGEEINWRLLRNPNPKLKNILTIGVFEGHLSL